MTGRATPAIVALVLLLAGLGGWLIWRAPGPIERSPQGLGGLALVLREAGLDVRTVRDGERYEPARHALRILPLHDADLSLDQGGGREEGSTEPRRMDRFAFQWKVRSVPSLVVMAKWLEALRTRGRAHPATLIDADMLRLPPARAGGAAARVRRAPAGFSTVRLRRAGDAARGSPPARLADAVDGATVTLYAAQWVARDSLGRGCTPLLAEEGRPQRVFAALCGETGRAPGHIVLTDPDMANNHGLTLGANADVAVRAVRALAGDGAVLLDASSRRAAARPRDPATASRGLHEVLGFLQERNAWFGWGLAVLALLVAWRAWVRLRPLIDRRADEAGSARRTMAIETQARLLRLGGHRTALVRARVAAVLARLARRLGRPELVRDRARLHEALARIDAPAAEALRDSVTLMESGRPQPRDLARFERAARRLAPAREEAA